MTNTNRDEWEGMVKRLRAARELFAALADHYQSNSTFAEELDVMDEAATTIENQGREIERLRARTKEIQQQEMSKRAAMDAELAEWRNAYARAREWTEGRDLHADWAGDPSSPFWPMTSVRNREALAALLLEVERARALQSPTQAPLQEGER